MHQRSGVSGRASHNDQGRYGASVRLTLIQASALATLAMAAPALAQEPAVVTPVNAQPPSQNEFRDCVECPQMLRLPGGTFQMGDASVGGQANGIIKIAPSAANPSVVGEGDGKPVHAVTLGAFAVGKYEVTRAEYAAFTRDSGRAIGGDCMVVDTTGEWAKQASATWRSPGFPQTERDPVACVSWEDAQAYVGWLSQKTGQRYRLLSESEWEYAARGGSPSIFWWGDGYNDHCNYANAKDESGKQKFPTWASVPSCNDGHMFTAPVGSYRPNGFGLFDMAGNVWEWVEDCHAATYNLQPRDGAAYTGDACSARVLRGGAWDNLPVSLQSAYRRRITPTFRSGGGGFRVARTL